MLPKSITLIIKLTVVSCLWWTTIQASRTIYLNSQVAATYDEIEEFKKNATSAWQRIREKQAVYAGMGKLESSTRTESWRRNREHEGNKERIEVLTVLDSDHRTYLRTEKGRPDVLVVVNPQYGCELRRNSGDSEWSLAEVLPAKFNTKNSETPPDSEFLKRLHARSISPAISNITEVMGPTPKFRLDLVSEFDVRGATVVSYNGSNMVRVDFSLPFEMYVTDEASKRTEKQKLIGECYAIFDPARDWIILEFSFQYRDLFKNFSTYEYTFLEAEVVYRSKAKTENIVKGEVESWEVVETKYSRVPVNRDDFTLTRYGFPEPDYYSPPRPWWMYVSITGGVIVVLGALLVTVGRRWQQR